MTGSRDSDNFVHLDIDEKSISSPDNIYTMNGVQISGNDILFAIDNGQAGDAKLFAKLFSNTYRFDHSTREWWTFESPRWVKDKTRKALNSVGALTKIYSQEAMKQLMRKNVAQAANNEHIAGIASTRHANLIIRANDLKSLHYREEVLKLACSGIDSLGISGEEWDRNPWHLACQNCVVNLQDGTSFPGKPQDLIKTATPVVWEGLDCESPTWSGFVQNLFHNPMTAQMFQRTIGCLLCYHTENVTVIIQSNDEFIKSILFRTLKNVFGNYVSHLGLSPKHNILSAVCNPAGKRFIWEYVHRENKNEVIKTVSAIIHSTTEGDLAGKITPPHFILITDPGEKFHHSISRLGGQIYTFDLSLPENYHRDLLLVEKLKKELSGILSFFIRVCIDMYRHGIDHPDMITSQ
ncbi:MAG: hypothetical protein QM300_11540 [Pseudomonadota bacterium]|nr:hypothetical protein [Pseudomonadota bacterium]